MATRVLSAQVSLSLAEKVDNLAQRLHHSHAWIVQQALVAWVNEEEEHHRMTLEGMDDVAVGRVVAQEEVEAWAASLTTETPLPVPQR